MFEKLLTDHAILSVLVTKPKTLVYLLFKNRDNHR